MQMLTVVLIVATVAGKMMLGTQMPHLPTISRIIIGA